MKQSIFKVFFIVFLFWIVYDDKVMLYFYNLPLKTENAFEVFYVLKNTIIDLTILRGYDVVTNIQLNKTTYLFY